MNSRPAAALLALPLLLAAAPPRGEPETARRSPGFVLVRDVADIMGGLTVTLANPAVLHGAPLRVLLYYAPGEPPSEAEADADGHVPLPDSRAPHALLPALPGKAATSEPIPLAGKSGHRLTFRYAR